MKISNVAQDAHPLRSLMSLDYEQRDAWLDSIWLVPGAQSLEVWLQRLTQLPGYSCYLLVIVRLYGVSKRLAPHIARLRAAQLGDIVTLSQTRVYAERPAALALVKPQPENAATVAARLSQREAADDTVLVLAASDLQHAPTEFADYLEAAASEAVVEKKLGHAVDFALAHDCALGLSALSNRHAQGLVLLGADEVLSFVATALGAELIPEPPYGWQISGL